MNLLRFLPALLAVLATSAVSYAQEPSSAMLQQWGLTQLEPVTTEIAKDVRGQGFTSGTSRSASALPGTFTYNLAQAEGTKFAKTWGSSLSELDVYVSSIEAGLPASFQDYLSPDRPFVNFGPISAGRHTVGASGYSVSSSN
jgi:hypothetical protein